MKPLAVDLYAGLGGWSEALLAEGYSVVGFDVEQHQYGEHRYPAQLVIQDVLTLHGSQFKDAALIVASPPCQEFSYMAMPWSKAKEKARQYREGELDVADLTRLFDACFRIQREACEAAGRHVPMIVENVRGAQPWVGRARWNFGSFYLWGDVPALMPPIGERKVVPGNHLHLGGGSTFVATEGTVAEKREAARYAKVRGFGWDGSPLWMGNSKSLARTAASAMIAKIPQPLAQHIARTFLPPRTAGVVEACRRRHGGVCHTIYAADMKTVVRTQDCVDWCPLLGRKICD